MLRPRNNENSTKLANNKTIYFVHFNVVMIIIIIIIFITLIADTVTAEHTFSK